jgi:Na+/H+ antiporter subunit.
VGILFLFLTVPTGAHMISRAAQRVGVPFLGSVVWPTEERDAETKDDGATTEVGESSDGSG